MYSQSYSDDKFLDFLPPTPNPNPANIFVFGLY